MKSITREWTSDCLPSVRAEPQLIFRIQRSMNAAAIVFALSGVMDNVHIERLEKLLEAEKQRPILIDLENITLVRREAVEFLARLEDPDIEIINCPDYVRTWIDAEKEIKR